MSGMMKKLTLATALAATAITGMAATATPAQAREYHGGGYRGPRFAFGGPVYGAYAGGCIRNRWVNTPWGPRMRRVNVCY